MKKNCFYLCEINDVKYKFDSKEALYNFIKSEKLIERGLKDAISETLSSFVMNIMQYTGRNPFMDTKDEGQDSFSEALQTNEVFTTTQLETLSDYIIGLMCKKGATKEQIFTQIVKNVEEATQSTKEKLEYIKENKEHLQEEKIDESIKTLEEAFESLLDETEKISNNFNIVWSYALDTAERMGLIERERFEIDFGPSIQNQIDVLIEEREDKVTKKREEIEKKKQEQKQEKTREGKTKLGEVIVQLQKDIRKIEKRYNNRIEKLLYKAEKEALKEKEARLLEEETEKDDVDYVEDGDDIEKNYSKDDNETTPDERIGVKILKLLSIFETGEKGYLGTPYMYNAKELYDFLFTLIGSEINTPTDIRGFLDVLQKHSKNPGIKNLYEYLEENKDDPQVKEALISLITATHLQYVNASFTMIERKDDSLYLSVWETNATTAERRIRNSWISGFNMSKLVNLDDYSLNKDAAKDLIEKYEDLTKAENIYDEKYDADVISFFEAFGIIITPSMLKALKNGEYTINFNDTFITVSYDELFKNKKTDTYDVRVGNNLYLWLKRVEDGEIENIFEDQGTPFKTFKKSIDVLVDLSVAHNTKNTSLTRSTNGKIISNYERMNIFYQRVNELKDKEYGLVEKLLEKDFSKDSLLLPLLQQSDSFRDFFKQRLIDNSSIKELNKQFPLFPKVDEISDIDKMLLTKSGFQYMKLRKFTDLTDDLSLPLRAAIMPTPTNSDKGRMFWMDTVVYDINRQVQKFFNEDLLKEGKFKFTDNFRNSLIKRLINPELNRIKRSVAMGSTNPAELRFNFLPGLNLIKVDPDTTLQEYLLQGNDLTEDIKKIIGDYLEQHFLAIAKSNLKDYQILEKEVSSYNNKDYEETTNLWEYVEDNAMNRMNIYDVLAEIDQEINTQINYMNVYQLIVTDIANLASSKDFNVDKTNKTQLEIETEISENIGNNSVKRFAGFTANGDVLFNSDTETYIQLIAEDKEEPAINLDYIAEYFYPSTIHNKPTIEGYTKTTYKELFKRLAQGEEFDMQLMSDIKNKFPSITPFLKNNITDGQEIATVEEGLRMLRGRGKITEQEANIIINKVNNQREAVKKGKDIEQKDKLTLKERNFLFQPDKPVFFGHVDSGEAYENNLVYIKSSVFYLIPEMTAGTPLDILRQNLERIQKDDVENRTVRLAYKSAVKIGKLGTVIKDVFDPMLAENVLIDSNSMHILPRRYFKLQQYVPDKSAQNKTDVSLATQISKLLFGNNATNLEYDSTYDIEKLDNTTKERIVNLPDLGNTTTSENVIIDEQNGRSPSTDGSIIAYRGPNTKKLNNEKGLIEDLRKNKMIGNPFGPYGLYKIKAEEATIAFFNWLSGTEHTDKFQEYRNLIVKNKEKLKNTQIKYYKDLGRPSHATALDKFLNSQEKNNQNINITWSKNKGFEVSSQGNSLGKKFSAMNAQLKDGRIIEEIYQLDIKGLGTAQPREKGDSALNHNDYKKGKGKKGTLYTFEEQYQKYKELWEQYLNENPELEQQLLQEAIKNGGLKDKFATSQVNQARALSELLNERNNKSSQEVIENKKSGGGKIQGDALRQLFFEAFQTLVDNDINQIKEEFNVSEEQAIELKELQKLVLKEAKERKYSKQDTEALKIKEVHDGEAFEIPLSFSSKAIKLESLLLSIVQNRIANRKVRGFSFVATSENGFTMYNDSFFDKETFHSNKTIFLRDNPTKKLGYTETGAAEIMIPSKFTTTDGTLIDLYENWNETKGEGKYVNRDDNGVLRLDKEKFDPELLKAFNFRIPTSSHSLAGHVEIVGILPPSSGDVILVPNSLLTQTGADFDIDKFTLYINNHIMFPNGTIRKLTKENKDAYLEAWEKSDDKKESKKLDIQIAENTFIDIHKIVYGNKEIQKKAVKPLTTTYAENQAQQILKTKNKQNKHFNILSSRYQREKLKNGSSGKSAIAIYAKSVTFNSLANQTKNKPTMITPEYHFGNGLKMNTSFGEHRISLGRRKKNTFENLGLPTTISDILDERVQIAVDNGKLGVLGDVGLNNITAISVDSYFILRGLVTSIETNTNFETGKKEQKVYDMPFLMHSNPVIKRFYQMLEERNIILNSDYKKPKEIVNEILSILYENERKYEEFNKKDFLKEHGKNITGHFLSSTLKGDPSVEELAGRLTTEEKDTLAAMFVQYFRAIKDARILKNFTQVSDMTYIGKDFMEMYIKRENFIKSTDINHTSIKNTEEIFGELTTKNPKDDRYIEIKKGYWFKPNTLQAYAMAQSFKMIEILYKEQHPIFNKTFGRFIDSTLETSKYHSFGVFAQATFLKNFNEELKTYLLSSNRFLSRPGSLSELRKTFLETNTETDNESLGRYIQRILKSSEIPTSLKENKFFKNLYVKEDLTTRKASIEYVDSSENNITEDVIVNAFRDLLISLEELPESLQWNGTTMTIRDLAKALIDYTIISDSANSKMTSLYKYIPIEYFTAQTNANNRTINEELQDFKNDWSDFLNTTGFDKLIDFRREYFRRNPEDARKDISSKYRKSTTEEDIYYKDKKPGSQETDYDFVFIKDGKNTYILLESVGQDVYQKVDTIENKTLYNYDDPKETYEFDIKTGRINQEEALKENREKEKSENINTKKRQRQEKIRNFYEKSTIKEIFDHALSPKNVNFYKDLSNKIYFISTLLKESTQKDVHIFDDIKVKFSSTFSYDGKYEDGVIYINEEYVDDYKKVLEILTLELGHVILSDKLSLYYSVDNDSLSIDEESPEYSYYKPLYDSYKEFKDSLLQELGISDAELHYYTQNANSEDTEVINKIKTFKEITKDPNIVDVMYSALNLQEFYARVLGAQKDTLSYLNNIETVRKTNLIEDVLKQVFNTIKNVIKRMGIDINKNSVLEKSLESILSITTKNFKDYVENKTNTTKDKSKNITSIDKKSQDLFDLFNENACNQDL